MSNDNTFLEWVTNYPDHKYKTHTINAYNKALKIGGAWFGLDKDFSILDIRTVKDFDTVEQQIRNTENYEKINYDNGHGVMSAALGLYRKYLLSISEKDVSVDNGDTWLPSLSDYNPCISKEQWLSLLNDSTVFTKEYLLGFACIYDNGGQGSCSELAAKYKQSMVLWRTSIAVYLSKKVAEKTHCPVQIEDRKNVYFSIPFLYRLTTKEEIGSCVYKVRPELMEALKEFGIEKYLPEVSPYPIKADSWEWVSEFIALKHCDKSFFDHHGSGVPKEIREFFQAAGMTAGSTIPLQLKFDGVLYDCRVEMDNQPSPRTRIFWPAELGKKFTEYRGIVDPVARFERAGTVCYEITISGGEAQMTVKETVEQIKKYIAAEGFSYPDGMIENFWLSLKSKPFVILAGTSGTGKTRLVKLFAKAIGAEFKLVPVRPDWSDSSDLFGHLNLNGDFVPGAILDFIHEAGLHTDKPYFLCLDEMNLARVEYYLSDFLSVIETRDMNEVGEITSDPLVPASLYGSDEKALEKYGEIRYPENLYVVGTVNMDETTFPFSKKVLDRANTIEFSFVDLKPGEAVTEMVEQMNLSNDYLRSEYLLLKQCPAEDKKFIDGICEKLEEINKVLLDCNAHVGYRVRDEILFYMLNNKHSELKKEDDALDCEILQKILPRLQGSALSVKEMLCRLFVMFAKDYEGKSGDGASRKMLEVLKDNDAKYPESAKKLQMMVRRFEEDGFTSYWL